MLEGVSDKCHLHNEAKVTGILGDADTFLCGKDYNQREKKAVVG